MLYFAYGSNLNQTDLDRYCVERALPPTGLEGVGQAFLPDRRLAFTHRSSSRGGGVLDAVPSRGDAVAGVVFRVPSAAAVETLDRKEGEGHTYVRFETVALRDDGTEEPVFSYEVSPAFRRPFVAPAPAYLDVIRRGYESHGLDVAALDAAAGGNPGGLAPMDLFVYGTLRRGEERHPVLLRHAVTGGDSATAEGTLIHLGDYPGLVVDGSRTTVSGELYSAADPDALFAELDPIETFLGFGVSGSVYRRAIVRVRTAQFGSKLAWTYVYAGECDRSRVIASGDWRNP